MAATKGRVKGASSQSKASTASDFKQDLQSEGPEDPPRDHRQRAASYSRFSSDNQSESSITDQQRLCREKAVVMGLVIPPELEFADYAISGTKRDRPGLTKMLADAKAGKFKVIYFYSLSRLGRESAITVPLLKQMVHEFHIRVVSISEGVDSDQVNWEMFSTISNVINEQYIRNLSQDVLRGLDGTLRSNFAVGDHRFGYRTIPSPKGEVTGRGRNSKPKMIYEIDEDQAFWGRKIFQWFVGERRVIAWIVRELNRLKVPKDHRATTADWAYGLVNGILRSTKYVGRWGWGRCKNERRPSDGQVTQTRRSLSETQKWARELPHLRIISDDQFQAAQIILDENQRRVAERRDAEGKLRGSSGSGAPRHMLAGLIECAKCEARFHTRGSNAIYMGCPRNTQGVCGCRTSLPRTLAEKLILEAVVQQLQSNHDWRKLTFQMTEAAVRQESLDSPSTISYLQQSLADVQRKIERLLVLIEDGSDSPQLIERLAQRNQEQEDFKRQLRAAERNQSHLVSTPTWEWFEGQLSRITDLLRQATPAAYLALRELLVGPIRVTETAEPGYKRLFFRGKMKIRVGVLPHISDGSQQGAPEAGAVEETCLEITLDFIDRSQRDKQQLRVWELHKEGKVRKEIAQELHMTRSRVTVILQRAASAR